MSCMNIVAVVISHRSEKAPTVQEVFTEYGCYIRARLGLHETGDACTEEGLVILQVCAEDGIIEKLLEALNSLEGVRAKNMKI